ncbi:protease pro-enzyme activation domain-containing protein [Paraburkholderia sp. BR14374]|uniref:S53 family peptidase n=1 Tax=Paraburkholderia sp. BR14374 TaxID=3237007 RepID=UPI0034CD0A80
MQTIYFGNRKFPRAFELAALSLGVAVTMIPLSARAETDWVSTRTQAFLLSNAPAPAGTSAPQSYSLNSLGNPALTDTNVTPLELSQPLHIAVALRHRNEETLDRFLRDLNQPGSPSYHRYLTPAEFKARFSPTDAQVTAVVAHLKANGFLNVSVSENNMLISADGNANNVQSAFQTSIKRFNYKGKPAYGNDLSARVPSSLASSVDSVLGLQDAVVPHSMLQRFAPEAVIEPDSIEKNTTDASELVGHEPTDFAKIYDASSLPAATNTTVGIIAWGDMTKTIDDLNTFTQTAHLPKVNTAVVEDGSGIPVPGADIEFALDSQVIIGTSGGVNELIFYPAMSGPGTDHVTDATVNAAYNKAVTDHDHKATIINVSLGNDEYTSYKTGALAAADAVFKQAVAQGQTFSVTSGDAGVYAGSYSPQRHKGYIGTSDDGTSVTTINDLSKYSVQYPASSPYVVTVGGTMLSTTGTMTWAGETVWNDGAAYADLDGTGKPVDNAMRIWATGGGVSAYEAAPSWQTAALGSSVTKRVLPDVAFDAAKSTGAYIIFNGQKTKSPIGGTSLASPIFVGGWARLESATNNSLRLPTPAFYENLPGNTALCHDVTSGNNGYHGYGFTAKPGWDMTTGFGSLDFAKISAAIPSWRAQ